jgi:protein gp37
MENSKIEWTHHTWNPHIGCRKVSPGCKYCYMHRDMTRYGLNPKTVKRTSKVTFNKPLKWKDPARVFTCSWSDFFIEEADAWRAEAWDIIRRTPHLTYQILTKRPERIEQSLPSDWGWGYSNVWIGVSVEDFEHAHRLEYLHELKGVISKFKTFASIEPLIADLRISEFSSATHKAFASLDWVIIGGESGNETGKFRYRPCELQWMLDIVHWTQKLKIPTFVKQLGTYQAKKINMKNEKGRHDRHGGNIEGFPCELRLRQFPNQVSLS